MIDILYLTHNRREFTEASLAALEANTDWSKVRYLWLYDDRSTDGTAKLLRGVRESQSRIVERPYGSPVAAMLDFVSYSEAPDLFAKIDNDTMLPPGWLEACLSVMEEYPELDLLGIEPPMSRTRAPWDRNGLVIHPEIGAAGRFAPCDAIGGIGLMRTRVFRDRAPMRPHSTYGGFTDWQLQNPDVRKGWIVPPLDVFLLDRLPIEPWVSLSREYIAKGWQRPWTNYTMADAALWSWWQPVASLVS